MYLSCIEIYHIWVIYVILKKVYKNILTNMNKITLLENINIVHDIRRIFHFILEKKYISDNIYNNFNDCLFKLPLI